MHRYYPGDAYVEWIGVDGYNFGDDHDQWHKWSSFEAVFAGVLDEPASFFELSVNFDPSLLLGVQVSGRGQFRTFAAPLRVR